MFRKDGRGEAAESLGKTKRQNDGSQGGGVISGGFEDGKGPQAKTEGSF